jgi:hypothetical protein
MDEPRRALARSKQRDWTLNLVDRYRLLDAHDNTINLVERASDVTEANYVKLSANQNVGDCDLTVDDLFRMKPVDSGSARYRLKVAIRRQRRGLPVKAMRLNLPFACEPATTDHSGADGEGWKASTLLQACAQYVGQSRNPQAVRIYNQEALATVIKYKWSTYGQRLFLEVRSLAACLPDVGPPS